MNLPICSGKAGIADKRSKLIAVQYFHLLFDRHEIVFAEGAPTESYHPFAADAGKIAPDTLAELVTLFPELGTDFWEGTLLGGTVRPCATSAEARLLLAA